MSDLKFNEEKPMINNDPVAKKEIETILEIKKTANPYWLIFLSGLTMYLAVKFALLSVFSFDTEITLNKEYIYTSPEAIITNAYSITNTIVNETPLRASVLDVSAFAGDATNKSSILKKEKADIKINAFVPPIPPSSNIAEISQSKRLDSSSENFKKELTKFVQLANIAKNISPSCTNQETLIKLATSITNQYSKIPFDWPSFAIPAKNNFEKSINGWNLLLKAKQGAFAFAGNDAEQTYTRLESYFYENPFEINYVEHQVGGAGAILLCDAYGEDKNNLKPLLSIINKYYDNGKEILLESLQAKKN